jgi:hypothetical protein
VNVVKLPTKTALRYAAIVMVQNTPTNVRLDHVNPVPLVLFQLQKVNRVNQIQ